MRRGLHRYGGDPGTAGGRDGGNSRRSSPVPLRGARLAALCASLFALYAPSAAQAAIPDIFISQAGGGSGASCANAKDVSFFNASTNWGSGSGQIGQGTMVHLCGTITTALAFHGSGAAGNPITLLWEAGAAVSLPVCNAAACIEGNGNVYLVLDGGANGIVENTANGSTLANQLVSVGINLPACTGCEVKNLLIRNIYVHSVYTDVTIDDAGARCLVIGGNNWAVHDNVMHDASWCLWNYYQAGSDSGGRIYNNEIYNIDHGIIVAGWGPHDVGPFYIYNNHIHDFANWDNSTGHWHHDGIHAFTTNSGGFPNVTQLWMYNNLFDGDAGDNMTAHIFLEGNAGTPWSRLVADGGTGRAIVFNNVFIGTPGRVVNGYVQVGNSNGSEVYNNTMLCGNTNLCFIVNNGLNYKFKNNFVSGSSNVLVDFDGTTSFASPGDLNNNVYANCASSGHNCFVWHGATWTDSFATWQAASGGDANSIATIGTDGGMGASGIPQGGSPAIGAGANLTSVGVTALNSDKAGVSRPASGAWDAGAYQYQAGGTTSACDVNQDGVVNVVDVQQEVNQALGIAACSSGDINKDGLCNVIDVQRVVNAALGGLCVAP